MNVNYERECYNRSIGFGQPPVLIASIGESMYTMSNIGCCGLEHHHGQKAINLASIHVKLQCHELRATALWDSISTRQETEIPQSQDPTHPHVAEERPMTVEDLLQLVPKLITKVDSLEKELKLLESQMIMRGEVSNFLP
ncbi:hypothetical protein Tco_0083924 [Tanacetum coccineum]